ncbi:MAG TPA: MarR family transcriptional regulator [Actinomycetes bacterium]
MTRTTGADTELASVLRLSVMRLTRRLRHERADTSLTLTQLSALSAIDRHGAMTPGELAAHERVQPPSMTRVLAVLEERALVTRIPHPTDGRQSIVSATDAARALLLEDRRRREAWLVGRLAELSEADRAALREVAPILDRLAQS